MNKTYGARLALTMVAVILFSSLFTLVAQADGPKRAARLDAATAGTGVIHGVIYQDWDQDGERAEFEPTLADAEIALLDLFGNEVARVVTGADGAYSFENLSSAGYILVESAPLGYSLPEGSEIDDLDADTDEIEMAVIAADGETLKINFGHVLMLGM